MSASLSPPGRLSALERLRVICEVIGTYPMVRWTLRHVELEEAVRRTRRGAPLRETYVPQEGNVAFRLAWIVEAILDRLPGDTRCLTRTLVLVRMLSRRGIGCAVVLGVRVAPEFGAHAWPELAGRPLMVPIEATGQRLLEL
jgi:hypothetical protein